MGDMQPEVLASFAAAGGAWAAAIVSIVSAIITGVQTRAVKKQTEHQERAADAAKEQTELQRQIAREAAQPHVWVDVVPDETQKKVLNLVLGNSGPTFAHNVRVTIAPKLPRIEPHGAGDAQGRLSEGITALGPGRRLVWSLGEGHEIAQDNEPKLHTITIEAEGPFGPLPQQAYQINLTDIRETRDAPEGNLHRVCEAINEVAAKLDREGQPVRVIVDNQDGG